LLALDIDGTILDGAGVLRPVVRDAIRHVAASGVHVILATGRSPWYGIERLVRDLGLGGPQIMMQGALIGDPTTGSTQRIRSLWPDVYQEVLWFADELGLDPVVATLEGHRVTSVPRDVAFVSPGPDPSTVRCLPDLSDLDGERPMRVYLPTGPASHRSVRVEAMARFLGRAAVVWSDLTGIELIAPGVNKGEAIEGFVRDLGYDLTQVAAVGDAMNDTEMLRVAGRSAAMGGAPAEVRAAADIVVPSSEEDGVLDALAWFYPHLVQVFGRAPRAGTVEVPA